MQFKLAESRIRPVETEATKTGFYIRKNIKEEERTNQDGNETYIMYVYDEALVTEVEYVAYIAAMTAVEAIQQNGKEEGIN